MFGLLYIMLLCIMTNEKGIVILSESSWCATPAPRNAGEYLAPQELSAWLHFKAITCDIFTWSERRSQWVASGRPRELSAAKDHDIYAPISTEAESWVQ